MAHEILMAIRVTDEARYRDYREAMMPILASYGGRFGYDFRVSEVLESPTGEDLNRVFTIRFPDRTARERFFADSDYAKVRASLFDRSVAHKTIIAEYEV